MKKVMILLAAVGVLAGLSSVCWAHVPEGKIWKAVYIPNNRIPTIDGDLSDWLWVDPSFIITADDMEDVLGSDTRPDSTDWYVRLYVGWNDSTNMVYWAADVTDDIHEADTPDDRHRYLDDSVELDIDADHSGGNYRNTEPGGQQAQQLGFHPDPPLGIRMAYHWAYPGTEAEQEQMQWIFQSPYCEVASNLDSLPNYIMEGKLAIWDRVDPAGPGASDRHTLTTGEIMGFTMCFNDVDTPGQDEHVRDHQLGLQGPEGYNCWFDADGFSDLHLSTGSGGPFVVNVRAEPTHLWPPGSHVTITAKVWDDDGVSSVTAAIKDSAGTELGTIPLYDDGLHSDGAAGDSTYGNTYTTQPTEMQYSGDIIAVDNLSNEEPYINLLWFSTTNEGPHLWGSRTDPQYATAGSDVTIWAHVWDREGDGIASVTAEIESPDETVIDTVPLSFDHSEENGSEHWKATWTTTADSLRNYDVDIDAVDGIGRESHYNNATWFSTLHILVRVPGDTTAAPGDSLDIPVYISDVTGREVYSVGLTLETDPSILAPIDASTVGSIAADWGNPTFNISGGQIQIAMAGTSPLDGSGVLLYVKYAVDPSAQQDCGINFTSVLLNEGDPPATWWNGRFYVGHSITGTIAYYSNSEPVANAGVYLTGHAEDSTLTDVSGYYQFLAIPPGDYTVRPAKEDDVQGSVTPFDAAQVLRHYVGLDTLTAYQSIAGDVSGNGQVTPYDAAYILRYYVGLVSSFPVMPDTTHIWRFVDKDFAIDLGNWPQAPEGRHYSPLDSDQVDQDYYGIVWGDVSGNWSGSPAKIIVSGAGRQLSLGQVYGEPGSTVAVPVTVDDATGIISAGITLTYDPKVLRAVDVSTTNLTAGYSVAHKVADGRIKIGLAGSRPLSGSGPLLDVRFQVLESADWSETCPISITDVQLNEGGIAAVARSASFTTPLPTRFGLSQNYPNPSNPETNIAYQLPVTCEVRLAIYNLAGQLVKTLVSGRKEAGYHTAHWDGRDNLGKQVASGIYFYRLQAGKFSQTKKMVLLK